MNALPPEDQAPDGGMGLTVGQIGGGVEEGRDRPALAADVELNPESLCGSYFIRVENGDPIWQGCVVAEPQAGVYLCAVTGGLEGPPAQVLASMDRMIARDPGYEWRFFDTEGAMHDAFAAFGVGVTE